METILPLFYKFLPFFEKAAGGMLLLLVVVGIHEFGHFITAKYIGARVDVFSIGFGKAIWNKTFGETNYRICWIPLGGYVKIYGQDPEEVAQDSTPNPERSLSNKSLAGRILVFSGGPLFNFILAVFIFTFLAFVGMHVLPATATRIVPNSAAWNSGLRSGDKIISIDDKPVTKFDEVAEIISQNPGRDLPIKISRRENQLNLTIPVNKTESYTPHGEPVTAGTLDGLEAYGRSAIVATTTEVNPWGLKSGDIIQKINDSQIHSWEDVEYFFETHLRNLPAKIDLEILRGKEVVNVSTPDLSWAKKRISPEWDSHRLMETVGLYSSELFVKTTMSGSPAEVAGVIPGDRLVSVNGQKVFSFESLRTLIQRAGEARASSQQKGQAPNYENAVQLLIERQGKNLRVESSVVATKAKDPLGKTIVTYTIGIQSQAVMVEPNDRILERTLNPFAAFASGIKETAYQTSMTVIGIKKLILGEVSSKAIGGPIMIFKAAGDSFSYGWRLFLKLMAIISIALGVFNLLPIPVLDGGHIVFALVEAVRGKPVSPEAVQRVMKVGISLLLLLMIFATYNDIIKTFNINF
jgi:regulator of sigma E protease